MRPNHLRRSVAAAAVLQSGLLLVLVEPASAAARCTPAVERLPGVGGAIDINNRGTVVGVDSAWYESSFNTVLWRDGRRHVIVRNARPAAVNDHEVVVGTKILADGSTRAFHWKAGRLTLLPGRNAEATGVNTAGLVVGSVGQRAATWRDGRLTLLPVPTGTTWSGAAAVNDLGQIVGGSTGRGDNEPSVMRWWRGRQHRLEPAGPTATTIDGRGHIIGHYFFDDGAGSQALLWTSISTPGTVLSYLDLYLNGTDGVDRFVGTVYTGQHGDGDRRNVAVVWDARQSVRALKGLPGTGRAQTFARGANSAGTVVGESDFSGGPAAVVWRCAWAQAGPLPGVAG